MTTPKHFLDRLVVVIITLFLELTFIKKFGK